jgi:hypothetical protein
VLRNGPPGSRGRLSGADAGSILVSMRWPRQGKPGDERSVGSYNTLASGPAPRAYVRGRARRPGAVRDGLARDLAPRGPASAAGAAGTRQGPCAHPAGGDQRLRRGDRHAAGLLSILQARDRPRGIREIHRLSAARPAPHPGAVLVTARHPGPARRARARGERRNPGLPHRRRNARRQVGHLARARRVLPGAVLLTRAARFPGAWPRPQRWRHSAADARARPRRRPAGHQPESRAIRWRRWQSERLSGHAAGLCRGPAA